MLEICRTNRKRSRQSIPPCIPTANIHWNLLRRPHIRQVVTFSQQINIETAAKVGTFTLPVTDATLNTAIGPISISRSYNSGRTDPDIEDQGYDSDQSELPNFGRQVIRSTGYTIAYDGAGRYL